MVEGYVEGTAGGRGRVTPCKCLAKDLEKAIYKGDDITVDYIFPQSLLPGGRVGLTRGLGREPERVRVRNSVQP